MSDQQPDPSVEPSLARANEYPNDTDLRRALKSVADKLFEGTGAGSSRFSWILEEGEAKEKGS